MLLTGFCPIPGHKRNDPTSRSWLTLLPPALALFPTPSPTEAYLYLKCGWMGLEAVPRMPQWSCPLPSLMSLAAPLVLSLLEKGQVKPSARYAHSRTGHLSRVDPPQPGPAA